MDFGLVRVYIPIKVGKCGGMRHRVQSAVLEASVKSVSIVVTVVVAAMLVAAVFLWTKNFKNTPASFAGTYQCSDFGIPDPSFDKIRITPEMKLLGISSAGEQPFQAGQLHRQDDTAEIEFSMETIHHPKFMLNPFGKRTVELQNGGILVRAERANRMVTAPCSKVE